MSTNPQKKPTPGERPGVAVIGTGYWGPNLIRSFREDSRVRLTMICDKSEAVLERFRFRYSGVTYTTEVEDILTSPQVYAVAICTPTNTHYALAKACLENGKDVLVEKPMANTSAECESLIELAQRKGRKLMVGHVFLFNPAIHYIENMIRKGDLGDIVYAYSTRVNLGPIRYDVNALWDLAPHDISIMNFWFNSQPQVLSAIGKAYLNPGLYDTVFVALKYSEHILSNCHVSWLDPKKTRQLVVVGSDRMVTYDDLDPMGPVKIFDKRVARSPHIIEDSIQFYKASIQLGAITVPSIPVAEPLREECRAFVDWVLGGKEPITNGKNGLEVVRVLEAAQAALFEADKNQLRVHLSEHSQQTTLPNQDRYAA